LSRDAVVDAALGVIDDEGLDGLTMRKVGDRLSAGPSALYAHVESREQLLRLALDRPLGELRLPAVDPENWVAQTREFARALRALLRRHPALVAAPFGDALPGPGSASVSRWLPAVLTSGGLLPDAASHAAGLLLEHVGSTALPAAADAAERQRDRSGGSGRGRGNRRPPGPYTARPPSLAALSGPPPEASSEERFEFGLDVLLSGLTALAARRHSSPRL
jgi:AcrR family transcriptional regulator